MIGLLDTHAFIWWDSEPARLSPNVLAFLLNPGNTILLSVGSVWEMLVKQQLGKLTLRLPLKQILDQQQANGIELLPVDCRHVLEIENLPTVHKDPFDRLLAAQARVEGAKLVTADAIFTHYPVRVFW
jgi:PIN domain nuclease of toxin-antitoxin system